MSAQRQPIDNVEIEPRTSSKDRFSGKIIAIVVLVLIGGLALILLPIIKGMNKTTVTSVATPENRVEPVSQSQEDFRAQLSREASAERELAQRAEREPASVQGEIADDGQTALEKYLRNRIIAKDSRTRPGTASGDPMAAALAEFELEEYKRALASLRAPIGSTGSTANVNATATRQTSSNARIRNQPGSTLNLDALRLSNQRNTDAFNNRENNGFYDSATNAPAIVQATPSAQNPESNTLFSNIANENRSLDAAATMADPLNGLAGSNATYFPSAPLGTVTVPAGTVVKAILRSTANNDVPGPILINVENDVYDITQSYVAIPKGTVILGNNVRLSPPNEAINRFQGMFLTKMRRPDGSAIDLGNKQLLSDGGLGGVEDETNFHVFPQVLATVAYAVLVGGVSIAVDDLLAVEVAGSSSDDTEETAPTTPEIVCTTNNETITETNADGEETTTTTTSETCAPATTESGTNSAFTISTSDDSNVKPQAQITSDFLNRFGGIAEQALSRFFNLTPTHTARPGVHLTVIIDEDLYIRPWKSVYANYVKPGL